MTKRFHQTLNYGAELCRASVGHCPYRYADGTEAKHYATEQEASSSDDRSFHIDFNTTEDDGFTNIEAVLADLVFGRTTDSYGIHFEKPSISGVVFEHNDDGSEFWRSFIFEEIFEKFNNVSIQPGYSMHVNLHSVQRYVNESIVEFYASQKNPFQRSFFKWKDEGWKETSPMVFVHKDQVYVVDGNHRFCAAKKRQLSAFAAVVIEINDGEFRLMPPEEFNRKFEI